MTAGISANIEKSGAAENDERRQRFLACTLRRYGKEFAWCARQILDAKVLPGDGFNPLAIWHQVEQVLYPNQIEEAARAATRPFHSDWDL